jgi:hypothetical protein
MPANDSRSWLLIVLGQQRSGTTALRSTLAQGTQVHDFNEVFHEDRGDERFNYFNFKQREVSESPDLVYPSVENQETLWSRYADLLRSSTDRPLVMIDVKYNGWHHFDPVYHLPWARPRLMQWLFRDAVRILHVTRRNLFAQACSERIATARGAWHAAVDEQSGERLSQIGLTVKPMASDEPVALDPRALEATMVWSEKTRDLFREWCSDYPHYAEVEYETLFDDGRLSRRTYDVMHGLTGVDLDEQKPVLLKKVTKDLRREIANVDEVRNHLKDGPFAAHVAASLDDA